MKPESREAPPSPDVETARHSCAHLMAAAVQALWPSAKFGVGPATKDGFYYDLDLPETLSVDDLGKIEQKMRELRGRKLPFERVVVPIDEAISEMARRGQDYKVELLHLLKEKGTTAVEDAGDKDAAFASEGLGGVTSVSLYRTGEFVDLCRGPHVEHSGAVGAFKLTSVAGAYWRGDQRNKQLQRIYGACFLSKEELDEHLRLLEEARKRDHRRLGQELDLFAFSELVGPGLPLFTPRGTLLRNLLTDFVWSLQEPLGYQRVLIPHITKAELYKVSGHYEKFKEDLFHVKGKGQEEFCIKPMNCPHHTQIYASRPRSYRDLPLRYSEVTSVYRDELTGTLQGLSRVRMITQDDAHVFCEASQITDEALKIFSIVEAFYSVFDMQLDVRLSMWDEEHPERYLGGAEIWTNAQEQLREVLRRKGVSWKEERGEAAFYGPKIDFMARDALRREWQLATIQLDFNLPERFDLKYINDQGKETRPVMLHRAILGSVERFLSILIEHYGGAFPTWLSPVQVVLIPIADRHNEHAAGVAERLQRAAIPGSLGGIRAEVDSAREGMQKKIRNAQLRKNPYIVVIGDSEVESGKVAVRLRNGTQLPAMELAALIERVSKEIQERRDIPI
ncbi:MAG: threonine--tRNA ligase [Deltaproteobacteria bacterium]|nr:threonine--tRNA ligase [Deltaproteobacteria bacterium]